MSIRRNRNDRRVGRESDEPIVAETVRTTKPYLAKGLGFSEVYFGGRNRRLGNLTTLNKVQELQRKLYLKRKKAKDFKFYSLYDKVYREDVMREAWKRVRANKGAQGIDGESIEEFEKERERKLKEIREELKARTYKAEVVKRVWIPKRDGKRRPLGIPTVKDRIVQTAVKIIIEPIFEADFEENSYGFRPKRSAHQAVAEIEKYLRYGLVNVVETDIDNFFNKISHKKLLEMIRKKIADKNIFKLIKMWIKSGIMEEGEIRKPPTGTPQGGVISPLLANIYLNELDRDWREKKYNNWKGMNARMIRYADDLVILTNKEPKKLLQGLKRKLEELGLETKKEKTRILSAEEESFDFLGFNFRKIWNRKKRKKMALTIPTRRAVRDIKAKIKEITKSQPVKASKIIQRINPVLRGWMNYFRIANSGKAFQKIHQYTVERVRKFIRRNQGKHGYGWNGMTNRFICETMGLMYPLKIKYLRNS